MNDFFSPQDVRSYDRSYDRVGNGPNYVTIAVAASETATLHAMVLRAGETPPVSSAAVVAGLPPAGVSAVGVGTGAAAVGSAASVNFTGEMFPSTDYVVYITLKAESSVHVCIHAFMHSCIRAFVHSHSFNPPT